LACFDDLQIGDFVQVDMARCVELLLCNQDTFCMKRLERFVLNTIATKKDTHL